jgi:menaquinone-dependent protoporphyrinogen oxidase
MPAQTQDRPPVAASGAFVRVYAVSYDGQAARIAERVAQRVEATGHPVSFTVLGKGEVVPAEIETAGVVVLIAAIRYGFHLPAAHRLLAAYKALANPPPLGLATVCLTARKPNKQTPETNVYLRKLINRKNLTPAVATAIAGKLNYPRYSWLDRTLVRMIMKITGGPTDGTSVIEYTDWDQVNAFADQVAALAAGRDR